MAEVVKHCAPCQGPGVNYLPKTYHGPMKCRARVNLEWLGKAFSFDAATYRCQIARSAAARERARLDPPLDGVGEVGRPTPLRSRQASSSSLLLERRPSPVGPLFGKEL